MVYKYRHHFREYLFFGKPCWVFYEYGFSKEKMPDELKFTLSLKVGKKRILISGQRDFDYEWDDKVYLFIPNNPEKMKNYLKAIEND